MSMEATSPQKYQSSFLVLSKQANTMTKMLAITALKPKSNFVKYLSEWLLDIVCILG